MKQMKFVKNMGNVFRTARFKMEKHSPEILVTVGIIGVVASAVMACRATTKVDSIVKQSKEDIDKIHKCAEDESLVDEYTNEDMKKDLTIVYARTGIKFIKLYAPSIVMGVLSITSILASNNILRKRNIALGAAYASVMKGYEEYRGRVIERFGDDVDRELQYGLKVKKYDEIITDPETGKEKKVKKNGYSVDPSRVSGYARFFEQYSEDENGNRILNPNWENNVEYNLMFIKSMESYANDLLKVKKRLFLNDVYEMLGLPITKAGQIVGWVYDPDNPKIDNFVDFGPYSSALSFDNAEDFNRAILLDFNVDGNIWDLM